MPSGSRASSASSAQVGATSPTAPGSPVDGKRDVTRRLAGNVAGIVVRGHHHRDRLRRRRARVVGEARQRHQRVGLRVVGGQAAARDVVLDQQETSRLAPHAVVAEAFKSEEHTSELQSLMRISYAVFCLKKKKTK